MKYDTKQTGKFIFWVGQLTVELYYPYVFWNNLNIVIAANTKIVIFRKTKYNMWMLTRSAMIQVFGFGFGLAWKHIDNPNREDNIE